MFRYEGCCWPFAHRLTGDGYARLMGMGEETSRCRHRIWKLEEDEFIRANYPGHSQRWFGKHLNCTRATLVNRLRFLGLKSARAARWRGYNDKQLKETYGKIPAREIARRTGFTEDYIQHRATRLGLHSNLSSRGHAPWNRGKHWSWGERLDKESA